jgi:hypothetical protein
LELLGIGSALNPAIARRGWLAVQHPSKRLWFWKTAKGRRKSFGLNAQIRTSPKAFWNAGTGIGDQWNVMERIALGSIDPPIPVFSSLGA